MAFLLRCLLLVTLMLALSGHGNAMAVGGTQQIEIPSAHAHHTGDDLCDDGECATPAHADSCCVLNHCLLGLVAEQISSLPPFAPARPIASAVPPVSAEPQGDPERPPRLI